MSAAFTVNKIASIKTLNKCTCWFTFETAVDAQPGQFVMAWLPGVGERPFSIAAMDPLGLLVVDVGPFSHAMHQLGVGDRVWIKGPLGNGFLLKGDAILLVGGGYGSAPLFPLAKAAAAHNKPVQVCLGARSATGLLLAKEFSHLGCVVRVSTEDGTQGRQGLVTGVFKESLDAGRFDTLYACGPTGMLSALASMCKKYRLNYQLSWEALMRCGMGLCGSCEVPIALDPSLPPGWLACFDGPVFAHQFLK